MELAAAATAASASQPNMQEKSQWFFRVGVRKIEVHPLQLNRNMIFLQHKKLSKILHISPNIWFLETSPISRRFFVPFEFVGAGPRTKGQESGGRGRQRFSSSDGQKKVQELEAC